MNMDIGASRITAEGLGMPGIAVAQTITERLHRERDHLRSRLAEVEATLVTIEAHPEVQQVIDALAKLSWLR